MSNIILDTHEAFNVPRESLGETIMQSVRYRLENTRYSREQEFWPEVWDWIVSDGHLPSASEDIFGQPRSTRVGEYISAALAHSRLEDRIADAVAFGGLLFMWEGPLHARDTGVISSHRVLEAMRAVGAPMTPEMIVLMFGDFAACGSAMSILMRDAQ